MRKVLSEIDLIQELIQNPQATATEQEVDGILKRIAAAPFNMRMKDVPPDLVGEVLSGTALGAREDSLTEHLARRVFHNRQWAGSTTRQEFLSDIRQALSHPDAGLAVYETRDTNVAAVTAPNTIPSERLGDRPGAYIIVFYSANRGRINSARQAADESRFGIPERASWIRRPKRRTSG